ncbi:MAG: hypothetical protein ACXABY_05575 [Candidatus Thorarchaeota archaeon]|jgi:hypothetical protein
MSDFNDLVWIDITSDFNPTAYADAFADDDVCEQLDGLDSSEEQLVCLYENGYLSKRGGRIQFLLPEDALDEGDAYRKGWDRIFGGKKKYTGPITSGGMQEPKRSRTRAAWRSTKDVAGKAGSAMKKGGAAAYKHSVGSIVKGASGYHQARKLKPNLSPEMKAIEKDFGPSPAHVAKRAQMATSKRKALGQIGKGAAVTGAAVAAGLGAHAIYKRMKKRKAAKKAAKQESWDDLDTEFLIDEAALLGFEFESIDELEETLELGAYIDDVLEHAAETGLTEEHSEEDIVEAALEEAVPMMKRLRRHFDAGKKASLAKSLGRAQQKQVGIGPVQKGLISRSKVAPATTGKLAAARATGAGALRAGQAGWRRMSTAGKVGAGLAGAAVVGMAGKALYKRMKRRKAAKKAMQASLNQDDLDRIIADSQDLGFDFESYDELLEALQVGSVLDELFYDYVEDDELAENLSVDDEFEVMECILSELEEDELEAITSLPWDGELQVVAQEPAVAPKAVNESYTGYRSSAQGSVYESAPVPFGTGNKLFERISGTLLTTTFGQDMVKKVNG